MSSQRPCPKKQLPFVSICLLTYNRAGELPKTINSLLRQTHEDFELIINDDCSPDNTEIICREYEKQDPRVKYFKNERNLRYAENQNAAIDRANSDFVAIVHDGDIYRNDLIEKWTFALVESPKAGLVFNQYRSVRPDGSEVVYKQDLPLVSPGKDFLRFMLSRWNSPIWGIVMVRKSAVLKVGPFDKRFPTLADVDMWMRILSQYDVAYVDEPLITLAPREKGHHNNPGNIKVRQQLEHIYLLNAGRFYGSSSEGAKTRRFFQNVFIKKNVRSIFWCLKEGRFGDVIDWIRFTVQSARRHEAFWREGIGNREFL